MSIWLVDTTLIAKKSTISFRRCRVTLEEALIERTTSTPSGGGFWIGNHYFTVRYSADCWEWEYLGNVFYDLQDLAEEIMRKSASGSQSAPPTPRAWFEPITAADGRGIARSLETSPWSTELTPWASSRVNGPP